ncbi:hypothetical protein [Pontimicrobium sp. IMCC45349]|uniref:hypothetical protein n=1 Tax=Pontimicrobium sp. IMCC45349 TaxID=3391574 RepID=UPI0039A37C62
MNILKSLVLTALLIGSTTIATAQTLTPKQQEREKNKVEVLTMDERNDIQIWFNQEIKKMNLDEDKQEAYEAYYSLYTSRMMRLDDKDKGYTYDEIMVELDKLIDKLNKRMKTILSKKEYSMHLENTNTLFNYIKLKMAKLSQE